ncbi:MAG TPA: hypothetical protein VFW98_06285 [Gemmatimonadaceae bacterium]|nr:hypothetical protein [Gemmatimonadaceae bacterium]
MGDYSQAAEFYDLLYPAQKDYPAESAIVAELIRDAAPHARTILDVACRMSRTAIEGAISRLEFEYLIGKATGLERRSEVHEFGLFTHAEMEAAFSEAGLSVEWRDAALRRRGVYVGRGAGVAETRASAT